MISDEMRELLSVYVDGELRDKDVARVEEMAKRDPEIGREIQAYKILRKQLRSWDKSEQDEGPSPLVREQAVRRARAFHHSRTQQRKGALIELVLRPLALAAALLIAVALGIVVASSAETPEPSFSASNEPVALTPLGDDQTRTLPGAVDAPERATPELLQGALGRSLIEENGDRLMHEGRPFSRDALNLKMRWTMEDALWAAQRARIDGNASRSVPTSNIRLKVLLRDFSPGEGNFVAMEPVKGLRAAHGSDDVQDHAVFKDNALASNKDRTYPILFLQGDILVARDATKRTRIVASDFWVGPGEESTVMPWVWADDIAAPKKGRDNLKLQDEILGSGLRREFIGAVGRDEELLKRLEKRLAAYFERKRDDTRVRALVQPLLKDAGATGFAVLDGTRVRGIELFGSHVLLERFAERLLRGYVRENGASIRVRALRPDHRASSKDSVRKFIDALPERALTSRTTRSIPSGSVKAWRKNGLENITLRGAGGKVPGHGLIQDDSLIHLTVFGE
jgi:negative regulator of sigma E activity